MVNVVFHESVRPPSSNLQNEIATKSGCRAEDIEFLADKARLSTRGLFLDEMGSIDDVRSIEEVVEVVLSNDIAREIMQIDSKSPKSPLLYQGKGQVIAVADTGLD